MTLSLPVRSYAMCIAMVIVAYIAVSGDQDFGMFTAMCICVVTTVGLAVGVATARSVRTQTRLFALQVVCLGYAVTVFFINRH